MIGKSEAKVEILAVSRGYARNTYTVRISSAARQEYKDDQLLNIVDAGGDLSCADECRHFGGYVQPQPGGVYKVVIYTD